MKILEYDQVDPVEVLNLNLLSLDYALTPERVALIRRLDPRPFPFFAVYAVEDGAVAGQVGVYRLPVMTLEGPEDVGGVCAVCTHPAFSRRGIAERLMEEAHMRMRAAGLRYSTLGTVRHGGAYALYRRLGYEDLSVRCSTFARIEGVRRETRFQAERATPGRLHLADEFFQAAVAGYLGFTRRVQGFLSMMISVGDLQEGSVWLLWDGNTLVGTARVGLSEGVLIVKNLLLEEGVETWEAVGACLAGAEQEGFLPGHSQQANIPIQYVRVRIYHSSQAASLNRGGHPPLQPDWAVFMLKPLNPADGVEEARRLLGIDAGRFLFSDLDIT